MSMKYSERHRALRLFAELHDGLLDAEQIAELEILLEKNPTLRSEYLEYVMLHVLLETKHEPALRGATAAEVDVNFDYLVDASSEIAFGKLSQDRELVSFRTQSPQHDRTSARSPVLHQRAGLFAAVCLLLVVGSIAALMMNDNRGTDKPQADDYIAVLSNTTRARWLTNPPGPAPTRLRAGRSLQLMEGLAEVTLSSGAVVVVRGPADLLLASPMRVRANRGTVRARVGEEATGFVIETPNADVVDLGTEFGVNVSEMGTTDVVVFEGAVDLAYHATSHSTGHANNKTTSKSVTPTAHRKRLNSGEALHVNKEGAVRRIVSINSDLYPVSTAVNTAARPHPPVITRVSDNIRDPENAQYYQVVHGGLWEDSRAYVDRFHEWNAIDQQGLPEFLLGADYVMTFNSDKWQSDIEIGVELSRPATLYIFYDNRRKVPDWLANTFTDIGIDIGVDEGFPDNPRIAELTAIGPGKSINVRHSVWSLTVDRPGTVKLGPLATQEIAVNMYGIAAMPLAKQESRLKGNSTPAAAVSLSYINSALLAITQAVSP